MKSTIQEIQKNKLQNLSKKLAILAVAVLGTFAMANAQTTSAPAKKDVKTEKHEKRADKKSDKKAKREKKTATAKPEAPKAK